MIIASSGCATTTKTTQGVSQTIGSDSIQAFTENPSGTSPPFIPGDTISFSTKETIIVSSRKVNWVRMVVKDVNTSRIRGEVVAVIEDEAERDEEEKEGMEGDIVEVKLEDINRISYIGEKEQTVGDKGGGFPARLVLLPVDIALTEIGLVVFITLLMLIL
jgi:hypothetical protein